MSDTTVAIGIERGHVVMHFAGAISQATLSPGNASQLGESLARLAYQLQFNREPPSQRAALAQEIRRKVKDEFREQLTDRATVHLKRLLSEGGDTDVVVHDLITKMLAVLP